MWHGPAYWCICSLVTAWCQLYIFIVSNYIQRLRPTFWVCSRWEFYLKTWIAQALSRMCAIWNIKHIFIFIHICYFMFGVFFFKLIWKYIYKIIYLIIYSVSVRYFVAEQKGTGHVEQRINEFSGRKLPINHVKVGQFYTHWKC